MSRWTHVAGVIRYDACLNRETELRQLLGKTYIWENMDHMTKKERDAYYWDWQTTVAEGGNVVPYGSEGSLHYQISHQDVPVDKLGHTSLGPDTVVTIWGDLRDFGGKEDIDIITNWFKKITSKFLIRSAILKIDDEGQENPIVLILDDHDSPRREVLTRRIKLSK